ncbi:hypothetical protein KKH15_01835 [Patescibacteria group bacterium]|nr:hypothetical protein [Patescibacteria group bacterium]MBU1754788.1 hypothetical protein [Patescibacteria group bacterium]
MEQTQILTTKATIPWYVMVVTALALVAIVAGAWWYWMTQNQSPFPVGAKVSVSLGYVPASTLFTLSDADREFTQVSVPGVAEGNIVIDEVSVVGQSYYLELDPETGFANLYAADGTPVTRSQSTKFNVLYRSKTNSFVFLSKKLGSPEEFLVTQEWNVVESDMDGNETVLGTGLHIEFASDTLLIASRDGSLVMMGSDGVKTELLRQEQSWIFTTQATGSEVAVYNALAGAVDIYTLNAEAAKLVYRDTQEVVSRPSAMAYAGDRLVYATGTLDGTGTAFGTVGSSRVLTVQHPNPEQPSSAYNLKISL